MKFNRWMIALAVVANFTAGLAAAHEGHDAAPEVGQITEAAPRSEAHTELFELLATPGDGQLTIFLDRYASNEPVSGAQVEVESGSWKAVAKEAGTGTYRVNAPQFAKPGSYPLLFTVQAGTDADLIETTLVVAEAAEPDAAVHSAPWWWGGAALVAAIALATVALLRKRRRTGVLA